jgi:glyoxylase-like metal-dependent hydrolase (beta-lactamase superfamily II)
MTDPLGLISDSNVLILINDADVVVVDTNILPHSARWVVAEIRKLTNKPVRYVVNTHWHSDHHYGNAVYREAYPGVEFIQHSFTREQLITRDMPTLAKNVETEYPRIIAAYEQALSSGKLADGREVTPERREVINNLLRIYRAFVAEMKVAAVTPGTLIVDDSLVIHRGARRIVVKHLGRGNTAGDLVVHLPVERIVATGDLVVNPVPFGYYSHYGDWPNTLRALKRLDAATIIPGHGPVMTDWTYTDQVIELLESVWTQVKAAVADGADLEATRKRVNLDAFRDRFAGTNARLLGSFANNLVTPSVEAAFLELTTGSPLKAP